MANNPGEQILSTDKSDQISYLQSELVGLDLLLERAVRLWQLAGQDPQDPFRGLVITDSEADLLISRPIATNWNHKFSIPQDDEIALQNALAQAHTVSQQIAERMSVRGAKPRLIELAEKFGLDHLDTNILLLAIAPALDARYERIYGYLQDDITQKLPGINLALDLFCPPGLDRLQYMSHFTNESPLFKNYILKRGRDTSKPSSNPSGGYFHTDESLIHWILGEEISPREQKLSTKSDSKIFLIIDEEIRALLQRIYGERWTGRNIPVIIFSGEDASIHDLAARYYAKTWNMPLQSIHLSSFLHDDDNRPDFLCTALRDCQLSGALPYLIGWEAFLNDIAIIHLLSRTVDTYPGPVLLSGASSWRPTGITNRRRMIHIPFKPLNYTQRLSLWEQTLGDIAQPDDLTAVAGQFQLNASQIWDACEAALDALVVKPKLQRGDLFTAARAYSHPLLSNLAQKITPRYSLADIVLPGDHLALIGEIINSVRFRSKVLETWGLGYKLVASKGITILFAGPPGTGKTMTAEIMAGELGLDLYRIDLSSIVSKYIGETEKNLSQLFDEAEASNAILFFDEADALFGKRSEVRDSHDRYANIEISYLLQRMEAYNGVSILATNLRANLDEAFTRRLQFAVDFPFPDESNRLRIWRNLFPGSVPKSNDIDLSGLAKKYKLAGGNIRNVIVTAAYLAASDGGCITMEHLFHSIRREFSKMGRLVTQEQFDWGSGTTHNPAKESMSEK